MVTVSVGDTVKLDTLIVQLHVVQEEQGDSLEESRETLNEQVLHLQV